jgi:hypothetical protein
MPEQIKNSKRKKSRLERTGKLSWEYRFLNVDTGELKYGQETAACFSKHAHPNQSK